MFPIALDVRELPCLVVGGGPVGLRKAACSLAAGARVTLVCLESRPPNAPIGLVWTTGPYLPEHLNRVSLVFAAATAMVNQIVVADAKARNIWVNSASEPSLGNFILPAVARRGKIDIAVSTSGASPAIAAHIRDHLAEQVDDAHVAWVGLLAELRGEILSNLPPKRSYQLLRQFAERGWLERLREEGVDAVRQAMREVVDRERGR